MLLKASAKTPQNFLPLLKVWLSYRISAFTGSSMSTASQQHLSIKDTAPLQTPWEEMQSKTHELS